MKSWGRPDSGFEHEIVAFFVCHKIYLQKLCKKKKDMVNINFIFTVLIFLVHWATLSPFMLETNFVLYFYSVQSI